MERLPFCLMLAALLTISACKNGDEADESLNIERKAQLVNVAENGVLPIHASFVQECMELEAMISELATSLQPEQLITARTQWKASCSTWKRCELYEMGPISNTYIHYRIHRWPADTALIEEAIQVEEVIDETYVSKRGSSSIGLAAIEYLLFAESAEETIASLESDSKRLDYLQALAAYLATTAQDLKSQWEVYQPIYVDALQNELDGGQNLLVNAMTAWLEETIKLRLENPLGLSDGGSVDSKEAEAFYSNTSLALIKNGFEVLRQTYTGNYPDSTVPTGFDDYLITLDNTVLNEQLLATFATCEEHFLALENQEMNELLITAPDQLEALRDALHDLVILIKVDMASYLGVVITVTDADGD